MNKMNSKYTEPEIEVTLFDVKDVIITSSPPPELEDDIFPYANLKSLK